MAHYETLRDLLVENLQEIFDAETRLNEAMPRLALAARSEELRTAFQEHHEQTAEHLARLREIFGILNIKSERKNCRVMEGLIAEANEISRATGDVHVIDAALIAVAQRIEHNEMAAYGCVKAFSDREGHDEITKMLTDSLNEEGAADKRLSKIAEGGFWSKSVNKAAAQA